MIFYWSYSVLQFMSLNALLGSCPTNGFYSKLKNADGTDVTCGNVFDSICKAPNSPRDYDCICTPPATDPQSCVDVVSFCCPARGIRKLAYRSRFGLFLQCSADFTALACIMPKEEGRSTGALPLNKFYYNSATNECETLSFNGAGGNANNFDTKQQCESYCKTSEHVIVFFKNLNTIITVSRCCSLPSRSTAVRGL